MSSPSSKQSASSFNDNQDQLIIAGDRKRNMLSDEEVQLLRTSDEDGYDEIGDAFGDKSEINGSKTRSRWNKSWPFIWFISASTLLPLMIIVIAFVMNNIETPFSLAFVLGIVTCIFGGCYFIPHLNLAQELSETYSANQKKRMYTDKLKGDVKKLNNAVNDLVSTRKKLVNANKETKNLIANFQMINVDNMEELNASQSKAKKIYREWHKQLIKKERILLHTLYDRFERMDNSPGMTKSEFEQFVQSLPDGYDERMRRLGTFEKVTLYLYISISISILYTLYVYS